MSAKAPKRDQGTWVKIKVADPLKAQIRKFRAKRELADSPITSDEKAILHLVDRGLQVENQ